LISSFLSFDLLSIRTITEHIRGGLFCTKTSTQIALLIHSEKILFFLQFKEKGDFFMYIKYQPNPQKKKRTIA